ncbi:MAG TPA: hypothetical protein VE990_00540, partial [Acidimicrobiales bacterium]|nr:hypothetical protein [Acidimicrobiales bacterium]
MSEDLLRQDLLREDLERVTAELAAELPGVARTDIRRCVREVSDQFGTPPITQYLPILVRRAARDRLNGGRRSGR